MEMSDYERFYLSWSALHTPNESFATNEPATIAAPAAAVPSVTLSPPALNFPEPAECERIQLEDVDYNGEKISYTDCMEFSVLRFMQVVLHDAATLGADGFPTRVDLELVNARCHPDVVRFFTSHPAILDAIEYDPNGSGFAARQAWARLVTRRPFFSYKRSTSGIYRNDVFDGIVTQPKGDAWVFELEPCVGNVIAACRYFLGVDFSAVDQSCEPPWADGGEGRNADVSCAAQPQIDAAMAQLSRPHMALQCVVKPPEWYGTSGMYFVNFDLACNKRARWRWTLTRQVLQREDVSAFRHGSAPAPRPHCTRHCMCDEHGWPVLATSAHSHIEEYNKRAHGEWEWMEWNG